MFPRRIIGLASLSLTLGFATDSFAQRRPDPPPPIPAATSAPERYQIAEQEVLARLSEPQPAPIATTTVVVDQPEPVDAYYGRRYDPPPLPPPPQVVYVERSVPPPVVYYPAPRYDYAPRYRGYHGGYHSGLSLSFRFGDDHNRSSYRHQGGHRQDRGNGHGRGGRGRH